MGEQRRLYGIDALRGIAALLVVALHTEAVFSIQPKWFGKGYLAVDFFLMLSGYLMARVTEPRLERGLSPGKFMTARYRRFWAMMALGAAIGTPYAFARSANLSEFLPLFFANIALVPFPFDNVIFALNIPAWTIFFELVANAAHVLVLRRLGTAALTVLVLVLLVLSIVVANAFGSLDVGARPATFLAGFPRIFLAYGIGILLFRISGGGAPLPLPAWLAMGAMPVAVLASHALGWKHWSFDLLFVLLLCPAIILGALGIAGRSRLGWLSAAISFPLFAIHLPILEAMRELGFGWKPAVLIAIGAALAVTGWTNRPAHSKAATAS